MTLPELLAYADPVLVEEWNNLHLGYTESAGSPALWRAVSGRTDGLGEDDVVVTAAPEEAIFLVCNAVLSHGEHMVGMTPAYQSSYGMHPRAISIGGLKQGVRAARSASRMGPVAGSRAAQHDHGRRREIASQRSGSRLPPRARAEHVKHPLSALRDVDGGTSSMVVGGRCVVTAADPHRCRRPEAERAGG